MPGRITLVRLFGVLFATWGLLLGNVGIASAETLHASFLSQMADFAPGAEECEFLSLVNEYRAANGVEPLALSISLSRAADNHSVQMAETDVFSHTLPDGTPWDTNIRNYGYTYNTWIGENLAAGNQAPAYTLLQWQRSPAHNANMLEPSFTAIGIAMAYEPNSSWGYYWTTTFGGYVDETVSC